MDICIIALCLMACIFSQVKSSPFQYQVGFHTNSIKYVNETTNKIYMEMVGQSSSSLSALVTYPSENGDDAVRFGRLGFDFFQVEIEPSWLGSLDEVRITQVDTNKILQWHLKQVVIVDLSDYMVYEFVVNKWFNSSTTSSGWLSHKTSLYRKYGGKNSPLQKGCMTKGSRAWLKLSSNTYQKGTITELCASNVTLQLDSGANITVSRDQEIQSSPLLVSDESFWWDSTSISRDDKFIARWNSSSFYFYAQGNGVARRGFTTYTYSPSYKSATFRTYKLWLQFLPDKQVKQLLFGQARKINKAAPVFCAPDPYSCPSMVTIPPEPNSVDALFSCHAQSASWKHHVLNSHNTPSIMECGMLCSRHAQCGSFSYCTGQNCLETGYNCELSGLALGNSMAAGNNAAMTAGNTRGSQFCTLLRISTGNRSTVT